MSYEQLTEHRSYLEDPVKLDRYQAAIDLVVKPGDVVLDLGSGTGVLGLMAARAGASRVYAVDSGRIISVARDLARANGYGDVVVGLRALSSELDLDEMIDVVVGDQIGGLAFDAGVNLYYADIARRLLAPGGRTIPASFELGLAPVESSDAYALVESWAASRAGFDVSPVRRLAANTVQPVQLEAEALLGEAVRCGAMEATDDADLQLAATLEIQRRGVLHGIVGTFRAHMAPGVEMTNEPGDASRMKHRWQDLLPLEAPTDVLPGDRVSVRVDASPVRGEMAWRVDVTRPGQRQPIARFRQGTFLGQFLSREDLEEVDAGRVAPAADPAARLALELADGVRSVADIEAALCEAMPERFPTPDSAQHLVAWALAPPR